MPPANSEVRAEVLDSITKLTETHRGQVIIAASHGAEYAAYLAAKGGAVGVILNDAGVGKDNAGISGLPYLNAQGIPAATIGHRTARIGNGADMIERGTISHVNDVAASLGCTPGQTCEVCAGKMRSAPATTSSPPAQSEHRILLRHVPGEPEVWGLDSISLVLPGDKEHIVISGSHGEALGGKPETALKYDAIAAVFNDAGIGIDNAGLSRLPALDSRKIPAATVSAESARIGDGRSIYEDGVISCVNETAAALGAAVGMRTPEFVERVIASLNRS
jgi:hypothetical protein